MSDRHDLDGYLDRIGYAGAREPTLATLAGILLAHTRSIAFENLDPLLGRPVRLDIASLQDKLVYGGRGGYCFEHNTLLKHVLEALGFDVTGLAARVVMGQPPGAELPRTHMLLMVDLEDGAVIADVGFGGQTPTGPLRLETGVEQPTPHEPYRIVGEGKEFRLESLVAGAWTPLYRFGLQAQNAADYEMMNHYTATHPASVFVNKLTAARPVPEGRYAFRDNSLALHRRNGETERRQLKSADEIQAVLEDVFGLKLPDDAALPGVLRRFAASEA